MPTGLGKVRGAPQVIGHGSRGEMMTPVDLDSEFAVGQRDIDDVATDNVLGRMGDPG